jgi:superoxide dismutase, Fe-Mn family
LLRYFCISGTVDDGIPARDLTFKYAHDASHAAIFNYASMAGNNHFFFERLHPGGTQPSSSFLTDIRESFDSLDTLKTEMIETADAMFGNGFVWLFKEDKTGLLRIFCTYNAGSPWPQAHYRLQNRDMATEYVQVGGNAAEQQRLGTVQNPAGKFGNHSRPPGQPVAPYGGLMGGPILCVNVWQHMYLRDYGVGIGAKKQYLDNWWNQIDWGMVEQSAHIYGTVYTRGSDYSRRVSRSMNRF